MPSHHFAAAGIHSHIRDLPLVRREFCLIPNNHGPSLWRPKKRDELRYYLSFLWHHVVRRPLYPAYHRKRRISTDPELGPHGHPGDRHSTCHSSGSRLVNRWATQKSVLMNGCGTCTCALALRWEVGGGRTNAPREPRATSHDVPIASRQCLECRRPRDFLGGSVANTGARSSETPQAR